MLAFAALMAVLPALTRASPLAVDSIKARDTYGEAQYVPVQEGLCGDFYNDWDFVVALDFDFFGDGEHCGQAITIYSENYGTTSTAIVYDVCLDCAQGGLGASAALFESLNGGYLDDELVPVSWYFQED